MELINDKYKVINKLDQNRKISSYVVKDIVNNKIRKLIIINSDYLSKTLINFLINNFIELSNIDTENILKVFNFGLVNSIDNKKLSYKQYYYTSEYLDKYCKINDLIMELSYDEIMDVYIQVCKAVNYLNLKGKRYEEINFENIFLYKKDNKYKVKLMDLVSLEVEDAYLKGDINGGLIFKAPEILNGGNSTIKSDIYSLGVLGCLLLLLKKNIEVDLKTDIHSLISSESALISGELFSEINIKKVIYKMVSMDPKDRYDRINDIVKDINTILNTNYTSYNQQEIEKINFNTPVVDREYELKRIISEYKSMKEKESENKCIFIHGETGVGKTKILKEVDRILSLDGVSVYSSFPSLNNERNKNFVDITRKIINSCKQEISETYKSEFIKFIPQIAEYKNVIPSEPLASLYEKMRVFKVAENFIKEVFKDRSCVLVVDNISVFKKFSLEILEYIYNSKSMKNLIVILSYNEEDLLDPVFFEFIEKMNKNKGTVNIPLKGLSFEGTAELIEKLLGLPEYAIKFSKRIYSKTYGNPLFIEETIKNFLLNKIIYIKNDTGKWDTDYEGKYEYLPIPRSIEQASINELNKIEAESYFILEFIAIFSDGVSQKIIEEFMKKDGLNYDDIIKDLISKGILCKKIEDTGFVYDFCSKILKDLVYDKIDEKVEMHREAGELLIKYGEKNIEDRAEIIYHLEKSNQNIRAVEYYIENSNRMLVLKNHREALANLKKAVQLLPDRYNDEKIRLMLKMADIYMSLFNLKSAEKVLNKGKKLVREIGNKKYEIDVLNREANVYLSENRESIALEKIQLVDDLLQDNNYKKGFIDSRIILANIYYKRRNYEKVIEICNDGIEACDNTDIKLRVVLYNIRGKGNMYLKNIDEAVRDYGLVYTNSKSINYEKGVVFAYINLATIYENYYQISDIAEEYLLNVMDICEKNKFLYCEVIAFEKLGHIYTRRFEYKKALKIFKDTLIKSKYIEYKNGIIKSISLIAVLQLKLNNYKEAFKYYNLAKEHIDKNNNGIENRYHFYLVEGEILTDIGCLNEAKEYLQKSLSIYQNEKCLLKWKAKQILIIIELIQDHDKIDLYKYIDYIKDIANKYKDHSNKVDFIYTCTIILYELGHKKLALKLFEYTLTDKWVSLNEKVKAKELYFRGISSNGEEKLAFLYESLKIVEKTKEKKLECNIYIKLGDYYYEKGEYGFSMYYYFESCEIIRNILSSIPIKYRLKYFKFHNFIKPFEKINFIKNVYFDEKTNEDNIDKNIEVSSLKELEEILQFNKLIDLLQNKKFMKCISKIYNDFYSIYIHHQKDIISNLTSDSIKNLQLIIQYLSSKTLATEAEIVVESEVNNFITIASLTENNIREENKDILERVKKTKNPFFIFNSEVQLNNFKHDTVAKGKKSVICVPVVLFRNDNLKFNEEKREGKKNPIINGYIYISSEKFLNNINKNTLNEIMKLINLIGYIIDKYQLTISCSIDKLTGAYTRKYLEDKLSESIEYANINDDKFSIIMFDLDHFKNVNDTFGHQVGDEVLHSVCSTVMKNLREGDICGRYGGEEFIAIVPGIGDNEALKIAERIRISVGNSKILGEKNPVTISIGIATYPYQAQFKRELIEKADQALYMAKDLGRNRCQVWKREFSNKVKITSKLTGIISGNFTQDSRNVLTMIELMNIVDSNIKIEEKIYKILGHIIGITEAEYANLIFLANEKDTKGNFGRKRLQEDWSYEYVYNEKILNDVIKQKQGICAMEWNETFNFDLLTVLPEWYSVMVVPIIHKHIMKAILYLAVPSKVKKFSREELNLVTILSKLIKEID